MNRRVEFKVSFVLPEGATLGMARQYVFDAITSDERWDGLRLDDPMSHFDRESVRVKICGGDKATEV